MTDGLVFKHPRLLAADTDHTLMVVDGDTDFGFRVLRIDPVV